MIENVHSGGSFPETMSYIVLVQKPPKAIKLEKLWLKNERIVICGRSPLNNVFEKDRTIFSLQTCVYIKESRQRKHLFVRK